MNLRDELRNKLQLSSSWRAVLSNRWRLLPSRMAHHLTSEYLYEAEEEGTSNENTFDILLDISYSMNRGGLHKSALAVRELIMLFIWIVEFRVILFARVPIVISWSRFLSMFDFTLDEYEFECQFSKFQNIRCEYLQGGENIRRVDGRWDVDNDWGTNIAWALAFSRAELLSKRWNRYVILITDGEDNEFVSFTSWVRTQKLEDEVDNLEKDWIKLISVWLWLNPGIGKSVKINEPSLVAETIINLL